MKTIRTITIISLFAITCVSCSDKTDCYEGKFCSGRGDVDFLRLIDESFAFFHPNPVVPNLSMVYHPRWDTFVEGAGWSGWWIQNSYGFSYAAAPFLQEPYFSLLQRSLDLFWENQGDGKRKGLWGGKHLKYISELIAPPGCLGDAARPGEIVYIQGDGNLKIHDWFYEATAAGVVMQTEILLVKRDLAEIRNYLPKMELACNFIENTRDLKNNLFLVGPACNLLAPSFGGALQPDGSFGKAYLTGLSVTYLAALDRMVELYKIVGDKEKHALYTHRQKITRESLPKLLTSDGYFAKSMEQNGIKHGVLGNKKYGYLEGVVNADAVALRVINEKTAKNIYRQIEAYPAIRPFDFLLNNAPGLDDTYWSWGNTKGKGMGGFHKYGDWVNGGAWGTVEGRAILMYYRLGKFHDIRRSAYRAMKWAKDFRMDAPWSQRGENINNPWSDSGKYNSEGVAVMIDNFAIPAATIRGLFDYEYRSDCLVLRPRIPGGIKQFTQKQPIHFGKKKLFLSCNNAGSKIRSVKINGEKASISSQEEILLYYDELSDESEIEITTTGGWEKGNLCLEYPLIPSLIDKNNRELQSYSVMPDSLEKPYAILKSMMKLLDEEPGIEKEKAFVKSAIQAFEASVSRVELNPGKGYFRPVTPERKEGINNFYEHTALSMYEGFINRMAVYADGGDDRQKRVATRFFELNSRLVKK